MSFFFSSPAAAVASPGAHDEQTVSASSSLMLLSQESTRSTEGGAESQTAASGVATGTMAKCVVFLTFMFSSFITYLAYALFLLHIYSADGAGIKKKPYSKKLNFNGPSNDKSSRIWIGFDAETQR